MSAHKEIKDFLGGDKIMKKSIIYVLVCLFTLSVLAGCGEKKTTPTAEPTLTSTPTTAPTDAPATPTAEPTDTPATPTAEPTAEPTATPTEAPVADVITDEMVCNAVARYAAVTSPGLQEVIDSGNVFAYWIVESTDENNVVIMFRSYTGAIIRYHVDRKTGEAYVTEYIAVIMDAEEPTGETFNVKDYLDTKAE